MRSVLVHTVNRSVSPPVVVNVLYMFIKGGERERDAWLCVVKNKNICVGSAHGEEPRP